MKISSKVILAIAVLVTVANICFLLYPIVKKTIQSIRYRQYSPVGKIDALMKQIVALEQPPDFEKVKKLTELRRRIVELDSTSLPDLFSYGASLLQLSYNEGDSLRLNLINDNIMRVAERIKRVGPYNSNSLLYAAMLFRYNGNNTLSCYDSADAIYNRILWLIKSDSIEVPHNIENDKKRWLQELRESVIDLKILNGLFKRANIRKYSFIN